MRNGGARQCIARIDCYKNGRLYWLYRRGTFGSLVALFASIAPSLLLMIVRMVTLMKYKDSPKAENITKLIRPGIAVLPGTMTLQVGNTSIGSTGGVQTVILIVVSYWLPENWKIHAAFVILMALAYGALSSFK